MSDRSTTTSSGLLAEKAQDQIVGFTATRQMPTPRERTAIYDELTHLGSATGFVTGACIGGDQIIGPALYRMYPRAQHIVIVPANRSRIAAWWRHPDISGRGNLTLIEMPSGSTYADRNRQIVFRSNFLLGYPAHDERDTRSQRSGSWQTLRMARRWHKIRPVARPLDRLVQIQPDAWGWV